jgi:hypothetical protein
MIGSAAESGSGWGGSVNSLRRACVVLTAVAGLGAALVPVASADPVQTVDYVSESTSGRLWIDVSSGLKYLTVELSAPAGETLHTGTYTGARFRGQSDEAQTTPGIFVYTMGNVCSEAYADFTIDRLDKDADGRTTDVDATFVQRCGAPDAPATRGEVHFHA